MCGDRIIITGLSAYPDNEKGNFEMKFHVSLIISLQNVLGIAPSATMTQSATNVHKVSI